MNKVNLIGYVGCDPEVKTMKNGKQMANFILATSEEWKDKTTNELKSRTMWHRVVVFSEGLVKLIDEAVHKGKKLHVEGSLRNRKWQHQDGYFCYSTEVLLENLTIPA